MTRKLLESNETYSDTKGGFPDPNETSFGLVNISEGLVLSVG